MGADKSIQPKDLPRPQQDADTKQAEEYIDKSNLQKEENELPQKQVGRSDEDNPRGRNQ